MAVVKDVFAPKPTNVANVAKKEAISEVQRTAEDIDVITNTKKKAEDLVGFSGVSAERDAAVAEAKVQREAREAEQQASLRGTIEDLGKKIAETSAGDKGHIKDLEIKLGLAQAESTKLMFDMLNNKISDLQNMKVDSASSSDVAKQIKAIKEAAGELGLGVAQTAVTITPPEIQLQLKKMDFDMQITLAEMADERARKDKEWDLQTRKWDQEKADRREELTMKYQAEKERNNTITGTVQAVGEAIAKATVTEPQGSVSGVSQQNNVSEQAPKKRVRGIEISEGEAGTFPCTDCKQDVAVAEDAISAVCANCGTIYRVRRSSAQLEEEDEGASPV